MLWKNTACIMCGKKITLLLENKEKNNNNKTLSGFPASQAWGWKSRLLYRNNGAEIAFNTLVNAFFPNEGAYLLAWK